MATAGGRRLATFTARGGSRRAGSARARDPTL